MGRRCGAGPKGAEQGAPAGDVRGVTARPSAAIPRLPPQRPAAARAHAGTLLTHHQLWHAHPACLRACIHARSGMAGAQPSAAPAASVCLLAPCACSHTPCLWVSAATLPERCTPARTRRAAPPAPTHARILLAPCRFTRSRDSIGASSTRPLNSAGCAGGGGRGSVGGGVSCSRRPAVVWVQHQQ